MTTTGIRVLWESERKRFLRALSTFTRQRERRQASLILAYDTGARVSEIVALDLGDYNRERGTVSLINVKAKDHRRREVGLHLTTVKMLNRWLRVRPDIPGETALFVSQKGNRLGVRTLQRDYELACVRAGIEPEGIHTLRHTAGTRWVNDGILSIPETTDRLGHGDQSTTQKYYLHADVEGTAKKIRKRPL